MKPFESEDFGLTQEEAEASAVFGVPLERKEELELARRLRRMSEVGGTREVVKSKALSEGLHAEAQKLVQPVSRGISPTGPDAVILTIPNLEQAIERGITGPVIAVLSQYSNEA